MNRPGFPTPAAAPISRTPMSGGWHCSHFFYTWKRDAIASMDPERLAAGRAAAIAMLDPTSDDAPLRMQTWIIAGAKADFGVMLLDPDPLKVDRVHQRLMAPPLGPALAPTYSFVSLTEISEYVFTPEQYAA